MITHGNGPQVGNELVRQERAADEVPPLPLYLAVAQTQAEIGALIETELRLVAGRPVACLLTHVRVDESDPAFAEPTKPMGPFYAAEQARSLERDRGWRLKCGRGSRTIAASSRLRPRSRSSSWARFGRWSRPARARSRAAAAASPSRRATAASAGSTP